MIRDLRSVQLEGTTITKRLVQGEYVATVYGYRCVTWRTIEGKAYQYASIVQADNEEHALEQFRPLANGAFDLISASIIFTTTLFDRRRDDEHFY